MRRACRAHAARLLDERHGVEPALEPEQRGGHALRGGGGAPRQQPGEARAHRRVAPGRGGLDEDLQHAAQQARPRQPARRREGQPQQQRAQGGEHLGAHRDLVELAVAADAEDVQRTHRPVGGQGQRAV